MQVCFQRKNRVLLPVKIFDGILSVSYTHLLKGEIRFLDIQKNIENILDLHTPTYNLGLNDIIEIDRKIRKEVMG